MAPKKMVISGPLSGSKTQPGYQAVTGAPNEVPALSVWLSSTGSAPRDTVLKLLDEAVATYHNSANNWDKLAMLGRLYFLTDNWLKNASRNRNPINNMREPVVNNLFLATVDRLCYRFGCSVNVLPQRLEEFWGRVLTPHGHHVDTQQTATGGIPKVVDYLDRAQAEKYRLSFKNGLAYQKTWWNKPPNDAVFALAESGRVGWEDGRGKSAPRMMDAGYAGFALSMGRQIFMAHHRGSFYTHNFFHSSYLSGDTVLCTGTMLIIRGKVLGIKNDSGHYQPSIEHLLNVVETLQMRGIAPRSVRVTAVPYSWVDYNGVKQKKELVTNGQELMQTRGGGWGLYQRMQANTANVGARGGTIQPL